MTPCVGVVVFPGSNCELDVLEAVRHLGAEARLVWHADTALDDVDAVVLPGGFAHGDYLRPGAIARFSPVMEAVRGFAADGGPVVGICNGFQVLCEAGLLPGALQKNHDLRFRCAPTRLRVETVGTPLTDETEVAPGTMLTVPINNFEGNYICTQDTLRQLQDEDRIVFRYVDNPNGSIDDIAGICSTERNVVGLMPHPERATHPLLGSTDGAALLRSLLATASMSVGAVPG